MAKSPKKTKSTKADTAPELDKLKAAIDFVEHASNGKDIEYQQHFLIRNKALMAYDGITAGGALIDEDLCACPNIRLMKSAIAKCKLASALTQESMSILRIKSDKYRANVPCIDPSCFPDIWPDNPCITIDDNFVEALKIAGKLVSTTGSRIIECAIMLSDGIIAATDGKIAVQIFHPYHIGKTLSIPKLFIQLLEKTKKTPLYAGWSDTTLTIFYNDFSWYRTNLYDVQWPPIDSVFLRTNRITLHELPLEYSTAIDAVKPFVENDIMYIIDNMIASHCEATIGAFHTVSGSMGHFKTSSKHLSLLPELRITQFGIYDNPNEELLFGCGQVGNYNIRVAISGME